MELVLKVLALVLKIVTAYTAVISICFLLPRKKPPAAEPKTRFAVLIPARNEERVIGALVESLKTQSYPRELFEIIVIPNNCTDYTAQVARQAGAKIMPCTADVHTKGEVLHFVFGELLGRYDAYCVFDADNLVDSGFLAAMNDAVVSGARAAKGRQCALNPYDSWISGAYDLHFQSINLLHSRARAPFGLSAKLVGTGFMVTDDLLQKLGGWNTSTLTEDQEFAAQCAIVGVPVTYVPEALTYDEEPCSFATSVRQRLRWSAGVQSVAERYAGKLLAEYPSWLRWDLLAHVCMIHVQLLALLPALYSLLAAPGAALAGLLPALAQFWLGSMVLALFLAVAGRRDLRKMGKAIVLYPAFLLSWYPIHLAALVFPPAGWKPITHGAGRKTDLSPCIFHEKPLY